MVPILGMVRSSEAGLAGDSLASQSACLFYCVSSLRAAGPSRKLTLLYLANDIVQNSKKKGQEYKAEFTRVLPRAFHLVSKYVGQLPASLMPVLTALLSPDPSFRSLLPSLPFFLTLPPALPLSLSPTSHQGEGCSFPQVCGSHYRGVGGEKHLRT